MFPIMGDEMDVNTTDVVSKFSITSDSVCYRNFNYIYCKRFQNLLITHKTHHLRILFK